MPCVIKHNQTMKDVLELGLSNSMCAGTECELRIDFEGVIGTELCGLYRSRHVVDGEERFMAVTKFEPTHARKVFPCWDEPAAKASFRVTLKVRSELVALSNMPVESQGEEGDWTVYRFGSTPPMSTYLLAFAIGYLECVEGVSGKISVSVWTPKGYSEQGRFALDVGIRSLEFLADYFGQAYPLPKLDMMAVPDFASGAMENWGLVTFRMLTLLVDESKSSIKTKRLVAAVVAHELAHQWFGNLVTMDWWSDLWLNEGFATWIEWLVCDALFPSWKVWDAFVAEDLAFGLELDALKTSHPIEMEVRDPAEIGAVFDAVTYSKGAAVIRMLEAFLGQHVFKKGLQLYLAKHIFANASTIDLWNALSGVAGLDVASIMDGWTKKSGFPLLRVSKIESDKLVVTQEPWLKDEESVWQIPLCPGVLLSEHSKELEIASRDVVKINENRLGFYRVQYCSELDIPIELFGVADRVGIVADSFAVGYRGDGIVSALNIVSRLVPGEKNYHVLKEISDQLIKLWILIDERKAVERFAYPIFAPFLDDGGHEEENRMLRDVAVRMCGVVCGDIKILSRLEKENNPDIRASMLAMKVRHGSKDDFRNVFNIYATSVVEDEKIDALRALGWTRSVDLGMELLVSTLGNGKWSIRIQDVASIYAVLGTNPDMRERAWLFLKENWDALYLRLYEASATILRRAVVCCLENCVEHAKEIRHFFANQSQDISGINMAVEQSMERLDRLTQWVEKDSLNVQGWLIKRQD